ncbi:uncharacterized protein LOC114527259 isoform X2 [Dendronephthya gigantea]|uniref:uncharacterized protein LOC114527259 isoform X2 n=1 Tax=Dendronephthya gigantea TaxID=151771 RepID=UPI00106B92C7|nr:uncharacterized protein LOC114527259 isoform X2 [Dendronephthya gigantea]
MEELYEKLHALRDGAGDFASSGCLPQLPLPGLFIKDVGDISLPVQDEQARKIIAVAKKAPFGLGEKTIIDESVRKSWELSPAEIVIKNQQFDHAVKTVVETVKEILGCVDKCVQLYLYKLLLYEKGGHFKPHRDTEKEKGMFATMIIQLPSLFEGGKLIVRHQGKMREVNFDGEESLYCCKYAAHYSDCEHEVTEITSGYRLALVYSLCWSATGEPPSAAASPELIQRIAAIIPTVCTEKRKRFVWFLAHRYSSAGLSGNGKSALKGHDACVVNVLQAANEVLPDEKKFEFYVAVVTRRRRLEQHAWDYGYRGRFGMYGDFEPNGNEYEEIIVEREWFKLDSGAKQRMGEVNLDFENEVVNYRRPSNMTIEDYKNEFWGEASDEGCMGPTGNAATTRTYWYKNYAIFAWPKANTSYVMCESGYDAAVDWIANEFSQVKHLAADHPNYQTALANLRTVLNLLISMPVSLNSSEVCSILSILAELRADASELANLFLTEVIAKGVFSRWSQ